MRRRFGAARPRAAAALLDTGENQWLPSVLITNLTLRLRSDDQGRVPQARTHSQPRHPALLGGLQEPRALAAILPRLPELFLLPPSVLPRVLRLGHRVAARQRPRES